MPADAPDRAYTATIGDTGNQLEYYPGQVFTAGGHRAPAACFVETKNPGGGLTDYPFHLNVNCSTKRANPWAVVNANGALVRGPNGTSVVKLGVGHYEVRLPADVSRCAYTATIGDTGNQLQYYPGEVFTAGGHLSAPASSSRPRTPAAASPTTPSTSTSAADAAAPRATTARGPAARGLSHLLAEQIRERAAAHHRLGPLGDDLRAGTGLVVAPLDQQPLRLGARSRPLEGEPAAQLLAVQDEDGVAAVERLGPCDAAALLVGAAIPDDHAAVAERALEVVVRPGCDPPPSTARRLTAGSSDGPFGTAHDRITPSTSRRRS